MTCQGVNAWAGSVACSLLLACLGDFGASPGDIMRSYEKGSNCRKLRKGKISIHFYVRVQTVSELTCVGQEPVLGRKFFFCYSPYFLRQASGFLAEPRVSWFWLECPESSVEPPSPLYRPPFPPSLPSPPPLSPTDTRTHTHTPALRVQLCAWTWGFYVVAGNLNSGLHSRHWIWVITLRAGLEGWGVVYILHSKP